MIYPEGKVDESAFFQGAQAGAAGHPVTACPYSPRSVKGKSWRAGFEEGRDYAEAFGGSSPHAVLYSTDSAE